LFSPIKRPQKTFHVSQDSVDIDHFQFQKLFPAEGKKLA